MQTVFQVSLLCVLTACVCVLLKTHRPEFAFLAGAAGSLCAFVLILPPLRETVEAMSGLTARIPALGASGQAILRVLAVALVSEFASAVCRDAGENALAGKVELCARVAVAAMAVPLVAELLRSLGSLSL